MGTKLKPGTYDCYANAEPDEPMFVLLARDDRAPSLVEEWADVSEARRTDPAKVAEARQCAEAMRAWRRERKGTPTDTKVKRSGNITMSNVRSGRDVVAESKAGRVIVADTTAGRDVIVSAGNVTRTNRDE